MYLDILANYASPQPEGCFNIICQQDAAAPPHPGNFV
jgi:hypothetical protein